MTSAIACRTMIAAIVLAAVAFASGAIAGETPRLETNEAYVNEVTGADTLAVDDPMAVLSFVLASLPDRVKVFPTENYYYFRFFHGGTRYAGNIRLAAADRDSGKVHFEYYQVRDQWSPPGAAHTSVLDGANGVAVERLERFLYRVAFRGRSVEFALNDLSQAMPPAGMLAPDEKFLGPVFDESGVRFLLVFNERLKVFHFLLDETGKVADAFFSARHTDRIVIGRRTGFAFYRDHLRERKILIGVAEANSRLNTYFDGPFDQLPENFVQGDELRRAILAADPSVAGEIDRLGNFADGTGRYLVHPYMLYRQEADLDRAHRCAERTRRDPQRYYRCFVLDTEGTGEIVVPRRSRSRRPH